MGADLVQRHAVREHPRRRPIPVDFISATDFSKMTAGTPIARRRRTRRSRQVEKVAEKKPAPEAAAQKITEKPEIVTASTAEPPPMPETKKPDPKAKPVPKPKRSRKRPRSPKQKVDPIAEALKKEEKKKRNPSRSRRRRSRRRCRRNGRRRRSRNSTPSKVAALARQARSAAPGDDRRSDECQTPRSARRPATRPELSQDEMDALRARLQRLWSPPDRLPASRHA